MTPTAKRVRKTATLADVAAATSLSPAAASLALHGKPGVSAATRQRVIEAAHRLGYRTETLSARRRSDPMTVALAIRALPEQATANVFYGPILSGIEEQCRAHKIRLVFTIVPVDEHNHPLEMPRAVTEHRTDGLILVGTDFGPRAASQFSSGGLPTVLVDAYADNEEFHSVDIDNLSGARTATRYLIGKGHRRIALVGTAPDAFPSVRERRVGYEQALSEAGLEPCFIDVPYYEPEPCAAAAVEYIQAHPDVTALFCANDLVAVTFMQKARMAGISIPDEVSVVGFDDIDLARIIAPPLTTVAVDKPGMGRLAVTLLLHQIEMGKECGSTTLMKPTLVERSTVLTLASV